MVEKMVIASKLEAAREVEKALLGEAARHGYDEAAKFAIKLALEEALNNAIKHGNGYDPAKTIEVLFNVNSRQTEITITDQGDGFDPAAVPDPRADENLEKPCGRGILLMRAYMDEVQYSEKGSQVYMVKHRT